MDARDARCVADVRNWLEKAVIGLNLCPFARAVYVREQIRFAVSHATTPDMLAADLLEELRLLQAADPQQLDTTLLLVPDMLADFLEFNDFLEIAEAVADEAEFDAEFQVAAFHPGWQFAGTQPDDIGNYTNRAPWPVLHLLREASIDAAVAAIPDPRDIYERNIETLRKLGLAGWRKLFPQ